MDKPPSLLSQIRQDLKTALNATPKGDSALRGDLGRALKAIERAESKALGKKGQNE